MLDYGARLYDPLTARWNGVDALAEKYHSTSGYGYVAGNPINAVDLDGREVYYTRGGKRLGQIGSSTQVVVIDDQYAVRAKRIIDNFNNLSCTDETRYFDEINGCGGYLGMTEGELNYRAILSLMQSHESCAQKEVENGKYPCQATGDDKRYYRVNGNGYSTNLTSYPGSSAAGAYQFLPGTWSTVSSAAGLTDFSAKAQDKAAIYYINTSGGGNYARRGNVDNFTNKMKGKWVSLPGGSQSCPLVWEYPGKNKPRIAVKDIRGVQLTNCFTPKEAGDVFDYFKIQELNGNSIIATPKGVLPIYTH